MGLDVLTLNAYDGMVRKEFQEAFNKAPTKGYDLYTSEIPATEHLSIFEWLGGYPQMRKWVGARAVVDLKNYKYQITNESYESSISILYNQFAKSSLTALSDNLKKKISGYAMGIRKDFPSKLTIAALEDGTTNLAYDGIAFFSDVSGVRLFDNLVAGSGITEANLLADLDTNFGVMASFEDDMGNCLQLEPTAVVCHPLLAMKFRKIFKAALTGGGDTNIYKDLIDVIADGRLTDSNDWYLIANNMGVKPIVYSSHTGITLVTVDDSWNQKVNVGVHAVGNAGYSFPQLAIKVVNA